MRTVPLSWAYQLTRCRKLLHFYQQVSTPAEAPEKPDHGDIDILVQNPQHEFTQKELALSLGATDHVKAKGITSFAIPLPGYEAECFQLDIHTCKPGLFEWETTIYTHGDLWRILGLAANRQGFTINDTGLHLRIAEIEQTHVKASLLRLTSSPGQMMAFLGLEADRFTEGFADLNEIFLWATSSRFFRRPYFEKHPSKTQGKKAERPMYLEFVTHWLPQHPKVGVSDDDDDPLNRKELLKEALETFDKQDEYHGMLESHRKRLMKDAMWRNIARILPVEGKELGQAMIALKAQLRLRDGVPELCTDDHVADRIPALDEQTVEHVILP